MITPFDFDASARSFDRKVKLLKRLAIVWIGLVFAVVLAAFAGAAYLLTNPELIGQFFGAIVSGFESAS